MSLSTLALPAEFDKRWLAGIPVLLLLVVLGVSINARRHQQHQGPAKAEPVVVVHQIPMSVRHFPCDLGVPGREGCQYWWRPGADNLWHLERGRVDDYSLQLVAGEVAAVRSLPVMEP